MPPQVGDVDLVGSRIDVYAGRAGLGHDHAVTGVWTTYIFIGSMLKDCRLSFFLGDRYRDYQSRVPGYPGVPFGPLARQH